MEHAEFCKALMDGVMSLVDCHQQSLSMPDSTKSVVVVANLRTAGMPTACTGKHSYSGADPRGAHPVRASLIFGGQKILINSFTLICNFTKRLCKIYVS